MNREREARESKLLTVKTASEKFGLEPSLIYHWIRYKKFPHIKAGKKVLFWEPDFLEFLEQHKVKRDEVES
ncbi:MAG: helix-turn-helix domain-containing protein [Thermodesulfobacteriota bacterium]